MARRTVGKTVTRKGIRVNKETGKATVAVTRKPKGLAAKLVDKALKAAGR